MHIKWRCGILALVRKAFKLAGGIEIFLNTAYVLNEPTNQRSQYKVLHTLLLSFDYLLF